MKRVLGWVTALILAVVILLCVGVMIAPRFGWHINIVYGGSMESAMDVGSLAVIPPVDPQDVKVGDIITFKWRGSEALTTHRVVDVANDEGSLMFTTKGDANEDPDSLGVPPEDVVGRVWMTVPYAGYAMDYIRTPLGFGLLIGIPAALIIGMESRNIFIQARNLRRKGRIGQA